MTGRENAPLADLDRPTAAGVYNCLISEPDCLPAARALVTSLTDPLTGHPGIRQLAVENRRFILAAVTRLASDGIGQFLDLGCGLPASPMVHQVARTMRADARVVYVDRDPAVASHVAAVLHTAREGLAVVKADVADPAAVLASPALTGPDAVIDMAEPAGVLFGGTLSAMPAETARSTVAGFTDALAPGSYAVISCVSYADRLLGQRMARTYAAAGTWHNHSPADVGSFFGRLQPVPGCELVADLRRWPAVTPGWRRDAALLGGIGVLC